MSVEWEDLLGKPYQLHGGSGYDCSTVAEEVMTRLGLEPPPTSPFRVPCSSGEQAEFEAYLRQGADRYRRIGDTLRAATKEGDLVLVAHGDGQVGRGLYTLVSAANGTFLSASPGSGVFAASRATIARLDQRVLGVYRLR